MAIKEFKPNTKNVALTALFIALDIVIGRFCSFFIMPPFEKFTLQPLVAAFGGFFLGPVYAVIAFCLSDFLGMLINNQGQTYNYLYVAVVLLRALFYGFMLYGKKVTLLRAVVTFVLGIAVFEIILTPLSLSIFYSLPLDTVIYYKLLFKPVYIPAYIALYYFIGKRLEKAAEIRSMID